MIQRSAAFKTYTREALARKIRHVLNNEKQILLSADRQGQKDLGEAPGNATGEASASSLCVLLVEDNILIRMSDADMVAELGYQVLEAGSAEEALPILETGAVDILVTDLGLPGMSGEDLSRDVRRRWPEIGIVFSTGMNEAPVLEARTKTALLRKPHALEELKAVLEAVV